MSKFAEFWKRNCHPQTLMGIVCMVVMALQICGIKVDNDKLNAVLDLVCIAGLYLGLLNNPKGKGMYIPFSANKTSLEEKVANGLQESMAEAAQEEVPEVKDSPKAE